MKSPPAPATPSMEDDRAVVASAKQNPKAKRSQGSYYTKKKEREVKARSTAESESTMYKAVFTALGFKVRRRVVLPTRPPFLRL